MTDIIVAADRAQLAVLASDWIAHEIDAAVAKRGHANIALAGGSTPQPIHALLAEFELPWEQVTIYFGDERCVAADDPESNYGQAARSLFDALGSPLPGIRRMRGEDPDRDAAARDYAAHLPEALDVLILGIGDDGHTASLFPGDPALLETQRLVLPVIGPKPPPERLTITPPVLRAARRILMIGSGAGKAGAIKRALEGSDSFQQVPARLARRGTWIIDRDAASELKGLPRSPASQPNTSTTEANMANQASLGIIGLGTMGSNLALNIADNCGQVAVWNRKPELTERFVAENPEALILASKTLEDFVQTLERPRRMMLMITAGRPVDLVIESLTPLLDEGDIIIDGGNSWFRDTQRREQELRARGLRFFGVGVSGGSEGARYGPSLMPGGDPEAYAYLAPTFEAIAATTDSGPCVTHVGPDGAGHFVKTVHNGIEYADMQMIAEVYDVMQRHLGLTADELAETFERWNAGPLESFLIEITGQILRVTDGTGSGPLVDQVLDRAGQKGTGQWTVQVALELGIPIPAISAAVDARSLSARKSERVELEARFGELHAGKAASISVKTLHDALYAAKICAYAQGLQLIRGASDEFNWSVDLREVARIWKGGCIIRARFLNEIMEAYEIQPDLPGLFYAESFRNKLSTHHSALRDAVGAAQQAGIPVPALASCLSYFDSYRTARLPQNLTQAQRDAFGAHTYRRLDDPDGESHHTDWLAAR